MLLSRRQFLTGGLATSYIALAGCVGPAEPIWDSDEFVARSTYVYDGPPALTLITVINNKTNFGAHSALLINASQRIIFDPAGTWTHPQLPERNDVHFGMTDEVVDFYIDYHSRITHRTVTQKILVSAEVAQQTMNGVMAYGAVPKAQCSRAITAVLADIPGFESIGRTWFPNRLSIRFAELPGVTTNTIYDNDPGDNSGFITAPPVLFNRA